MGSRAAHSLEHGFLKNKAEKLLERGIPSYNQKQLPENKETKLLLVLG